MSTLAKKSYGCSYAEAEELALSIYRRYILQLPSNDVKKIAKDAIRLWEAQKRIKIDNGEKEADE